MRSLLDDSSVVDHHNTVCAGDRREAVGDDECCPPLEQPEQGVLDDLLGLRVHGGGGLIQNQDPGIGQKGATTKDERIASAVDIMAVCLGEDTEKPGGYQGKIIRQP